MHDRLILWLHRVVSRRAQKIYERTYRDKQRSNYEVGVRAAQSKWQRAIDETRGR